MDDWSRDFQNMWSKFETYLIHNKVTWPSKKPKCKLLGIPKCISIHSGTSNNSFHPCLPKCRLSGNQCFMDRGQVCDNIPSLRGCCTVSNLRLGLPALGSSLTFMSEFEGLSGLHVDWCISTWGIESGGFWLWQWVTLVAPIVELLELTMTLILCHLRESASRGWGKTCKPDFARHGPVFNWQGWCWI